MLSERKQKLVFISTIILLGAVIYSFNLNNELFWDDDDWIVNNPSVHQLSWDNIKFWFTHDVLAGVGLKSNYYRPFLFFTFALNYAIAGIKPLSYHLLSNALHIINSLLIFSLFSKILKKRWPSFVAAVLFLVHPISTEAVTYISGRGDPLYVMFTLLGLWLFYISETKPLGWLSWQKAASLLALILGLLSREVAIVFPLLALIFAACFVETGTVIRSFMNALKRTWPYFAVVGIYGFLRLTILNFSNTLNFYTVSNIYSENLHVRMLTFLHAIFDYVGILIFPVNLHMERDVPIHLSLFDWPVWLVGAILLGVIYGFYKFYRSTKGSSTFRLWFFAFLWFFISLAPVSGITPINARIYEHWLYLPMIGFLLVVCSYLTKLLNHLKSKNLLAFRMAVTMLVAYVSFLSYQSIQRNILWGKPIEFYTDILKYEESVRINNNLGNKYQAAGNIAKAEEHYIAAIKLEDIFPQPHYNLGRIQEARGDIGGAIASYQRAIELNPSFYFAYQNLITLYSRQGDLVTTRDLLDKLNTIKPNDPIVLYNLSLLHKFMGNSRLALEYAQKGLAVAVPGSQVYQALERILTEVR